MTKAVGSSAGFDGIKRGEFGAGGGEFGGFFGREFVFFEANALIRGLSPGELHDLLFISRALFARFQEHGIHFCGKFLHGVALRSLDAVLRISSMIFAAHGGCFPLGLFLVCVPGALLLSPGVCLLAR